MKTHGHNTLRTRILAGTTAAIMAVGLASPSFAVEPLPLHQKPAAAAPDSGYGYRQTAWAPERSETAIDGTFLDTVGDFFDDLFNVRNLDAHREREAQLNTQPDVMNASTNGEPQSASVPE